MKYRKKPVVIEAFHWVEGEATSNGMPPWLTKAVFSGDVRVDINDSGDLKSYIRTLEGVMEASVGDYIIKGVKGELYPCKPDIFEATYDPAE